MADARFLSTARQIYMARDPTVNDPPSFRDLIPELHVLALSYLPRPPPDTLIDLTPTPDISLVDGSIVQFQPELGANGNSLRAMAMFYRPTGVSLKLTINPEMSEAMYSFYGPSHLDIQTDGPVRIYVDRFHQDVTSLNIESTHNQDISLDSIIDRMQTQSSELHYNFNVDGGGSSVRASSVDELRRSMRRFIQKGLDVMGSNTDNDFSRSLCFDVPFGAEWDDDDAHFYLDNRAPLTPGVTHVGHPTTKSSVVYKSATANVPERIMKYSCNNNVVELEILTMR